MIAPSPGRLEGHGVRLEPLGPAHADGLAAAAADGRLHRPGTVLYSILAHEWPDVRRHLAWRLARRAG